LSAPERGLSATFATSVAAQIAKSLPLVAVDTPRKSSVDVLVAVATVRKSSVDVLVAVATARKSSVDVLAAVAHDPRVVGQRPGRGGDDP
jgi:hypothetical protein